MLRFGDLFCGGGLGARGAVMAGAVPVLAVDGWNIAADTYRDNFPTATIHASRIQGLDPRALAKHHTIDILLTSPECTNHSLAKGAGPRSESSRELALTSLDWVRAFRPRWVILENVPQMRSWKRYDEIVAGLKKLDYGVREEVACATEFGVPQARRRLFILADSKREPAPIHRSKPTTKTVRSILDPRGTYSTTPLFRKGRAKATIARASKAIDALGSSTPFLIVYYGSDGSGGWQSLDEPLRTVTTLDRFALVEKRKSGWEMRMLQPTELAKAMGVPKQHKFQYGSRRDRVKLCGNGVCSPVMERMVESLTTA